MNFADKKILNLLSPEEKTLLKKMCFTLKKIKKKISTKKYLIGEFEIQKLIEQKELFCKKLEDQNFALKMKLIFKGGFLLISIFLIIYKLFS